MKKFIKGLALSVAVLGASLIGVNIASAEEVSVVENNVGNGEEYIYEITEINGNEIHGNAVNKESFDNAGIFLYQDEVSFDVEIGDKIAVVWGEEEDVFELIDRAILLEDGTYMSETKFNEYYHNNIADGVEYLYEVTDIIGDEVHGEALNFVSDDNVGIFLYKDELDFDVAVGDIISVVWGEEEDIFEDIQNADNSEFVSETEKAIQDLIQALKNS